MTEPVLERLFRPRSIAIVGASTRADAIGARVIANLHRFGFGGTILPVNPRYDEVASLRCHPSIESLPDGVDAAFIAIPAESVPEALERVGRRGVRCAFVNASGFADGGPAGRILQAELARVASRHRIALCGPNNMGLINVHDGAAIWTQRNTPPIAPGPLAVIAQSGSVTLVLAEDERKLGFSYLVTTGNEAVLGVADYLGHIARDERVRTVLLFVESIRDPRTFGDAAEQARAAGKRIVALKTGASQRGRSLVRAHTDSLAGDDAIYDAFFRRHGVIRVHDLDEMLETALLVTAYPRPPARRHVVPVTLSGGEAALIADLSTRVGLDLPPLSDATVAALRPAFPDFARPQNPLDGWGLGFNPTNFGLILDALQTQPDIGAIALSVDAPANGGGDVPYTLQMTELLGQPEHRKPVIVFNNAAGGGPNPEVRARLDPLGIPYLSGMRNALAALAHWLGPADPVPQPIFERDHRDAGPALREGPLRESALFAELAKAGVPMSPSRPAATAEEAVAAAGSFGYPVALKGCAAEVPHKTEHGLVRLALSGEAALRSAHAEVSAVLDRLAAGSPTREIVVQPMAHEGIELIAAVRHDPDFGPLVVVGLGGVWAEFVGSVSIRLGPIDAAAARLMLEECRAAEALAGLRGHGPYDIEAAVEAVAALSRIGAAAGPRMGSLEINPLIVGRRGAVGVDALLTAPTRAPE